MRKQPFKDFISGAASRPERERSTFEETPLKNQMRVFSLERKNEKNLFSITSTRVIVFASLLMFVVFLWISSSFSGVVVRVTTISEKINLEDTFIAAISDDVVNDAVTYKSMRIEESASLPIVATESKIVSQKASGEIIIYNNYSEAPQILIAGTRFESPDGKIFKIDKPVTVPGRKLVAGKYVPGSLTVTVYAAEAGKEYNISATDYTLPGLKESPRYKSVYARGKGEMSGGYIGEMKIVSPSDVSLTKKKLENALKEKLLAESKKKIPPGYITYEDASFISFEDNTKEIGSEWEGDKVYLKMKATLDSFIFNKKELASIIAKKKLPSLANYNVHSNNLSDLNFHILARDIVTPESKMFSFKLSGETLVTWDLDVDRFKNDLLGIKKDSYQDIFKKYPTIEKAETIFSPSWSRSFPNSIERINVEFIED